MARILVAEDDAAQRGLLCRRLTRAGHEPAQVASGEELIDVARHQPPDLILLDMNLPGLDGLEAARRLRARPATAQVPIIAVTGRVMSGDRDAALQAGCNDLEPKPVDMARLLKRIETLLAAAAKSKSAVAAPPPQPAAPVFVAPVAPVTPVAPVAPVAYVAPPPAPAVTLTVRPPSAAEPAAVAPAAPVPAEAAPEAAHAAGRILVVEDHDVNRELLARRLTRQGYDVGQAADGRQCLDRLREAPFDLVLLDVMMPEMDGYQALEAIKGDPELRHIPVLMISALDTMASVVRCIEAGADDYLPKPYDPVLLKARVTACLEKKRLRDGELQYLRDVAAVTAAAASLEQGQFDASLLAPAAARHDALGKLARVFERMATEIDAREQRLRLEVKQLRVQIDTRRTESQVAEITETSYFQSLQQKIRELRARPRGES